MLGALPSVLLVLLVAVQALVPAQAIVKEQAVHPWTGTRENSWPEAYRFEKDRDHDFWKVLGEASDDDLEAVLLVDIEWFYALWPVSERADNVAHFFTEHDNSPPEDWAKLMEEVATITLFKRSGTPLNEALIIAYIDCIVAQSPHYVLIRGPDCPGRADRIAAEWDARR